MKNSVKKIFWACDHAGLTLKKQLLEVLAKKPGFQCHDLGPFEDARVDYPDYASLLVKAIEQETKQNKKADGAHADDVFGVLLCGSGIGMAMAANRFSFIRAAVCRSIVDARLAREHNDANVLCLGARMTPPSMALDIFNIWVETPFAGDRHQSRIKKMEQLGK